ncbi:MAG: RsmE family RNA methyltransferase [Acidimicrobiales bacterium]
MADAGRAPDPVATGARAHVFVTDLDRPVPSDPDRHHLERVLRLAAGDLVTLSDGAGAWRMARLVPGRPPEPDGAIHHVARPTPLLTVCFAPVKNERPEWVVQKLTEAGVDRIVPFAAERSVVRWDADRAVRQHRRLSRVARASAMQCRRVWLPKVDRLTEFADAVAIPGAALAERLGPPPTLDRPVILVGPEGGWSPGEIDVDVPHVGLGPHVLRAETAAVAAGLLLAGLRAGVVHPA